MDFNKWVNQAFETGTIAFEKTGAALGDGVNYLTGTLSRSRLFGSTESSANYDAARTDEKHYFLVPDRQTEIGYALYVMRCLPDGVPPINDLPKRRFLHLPNEHALPTVEAIMLSEARKTAGEKVDGTFGDRLNQLADEIDKMDEKMFGGVLLVGGLVALVNPLAGAAVAAKALIPSVGICLSKNGLKMAGEKANQRQVAKQVKAAEKDVLKQFKQSKTDSLVNPLLAQLDRSLETSEMEYDPVFEFDSTELEFGVLDRERLLKLSCQAITNTYAETLDQPEAREAAKLGPEDIRFLKLIRALASDDDPAD